MFCQLDRLRRCLSPRIRRALEELPETLDETHERTLLDIDDENWAYTHCLFQCIVVAFSVKEYLTSSRIAEGHVSRYYIPLEPAHIFVAQACLSILLQLDKHVTKTSAEDFRLVWYAGQYWVEHAEFRNVSSHRVTQKI